MQKTSKNSDHGLVFLGLTGNIGSGKSTVTSIFQKMGSAIIDSDQVVSFIYDLGSLDKFFNEDNYLEAKHKITIKNQIILIREEILRNFKSLEKKEIARQIFAKTNLANELKTKLEKLIHPFVNEFIILWSEACSKRGVRLLVNEVQLLFEANLEKRFRKTLLVYTKDQLRKQRFIERAKIIADETQLEFHLDEAINDFNSRNQKQMSQDLKKQKADLIIYNNGNLTELQKQVKEIYLKLTEKKV